MSFSNFIEWSIHNFGSYPERKVVFFFGKPTAFKLKNIILSGSYLPSTKFVALPPCRSQGCLNGCLTGFWGRRCTSRCECPIGTPCQQRTGTCHTPRSSPIATRLMVTCTPTYITSPSNT